MAATSLRAHSYTPLQTINRGNYFMRPLRSSFAGRQKSAVELLQESKCLYVKSETVLDHQQQLKSSSPENLHSIVKVRPPPVPPKSAQLRRSYHSSASSTDQLQAKLRKLLNADSKENLIEDVGGAEARRRPSSQKQGRRKSQPCPGPQRHKSMPDLHSQAPDTRGRDSSSSDSSPPITCQYQLYTGDRKCSSPRESINDCASLDSSTSKSKHESSQASVHSLRGPSSLGPPSPVKSSVSFGGCPSRRPRPEMLWSTKTTDTCESEEGRLRPILRSKSDVGHARPPLPPPPTPAHLDTFFEQLGLDSPEFQSITRVSSQTSSPVFFSDTSSVDSGTLWATNHSAAGGSEGGAGVGEVTSIVERNARIIKWLCNCRKAQLSDSPPLPPPPIGFS